MLKSGIYRITCLINGKFYIGSSINLNKRFSDHKSDLNNDTHYNIHLQRAWNKYSEKYFDFDIIEYCEINILLEREQYYIDYMKPQFNLCKTAGSCLGYKHTKEFCEKISNIQKRKIGKKHTKESCDKISKANYGRKFSREHCVKLSESHIGQVSVKRRFCNEEIILIRNSKKVCRQLAKEYGVSSSTICRIKKYEVYKLKDEGK